MKYPVLGALIYSTLSTAAAGPPVRSWLQRKNSFDLPNERSLHTVPTPRGGGLACAAGAVVGAFACGRVGLGISAEWVWATAILGSVGWVDDITGLPAVPRLSAQIGSGAVLGMRSGGVRGAVISAFALPAIVNAFNFMDGINGISGGMAATWGISVFTDIERESGVRMQAAITAGMGLGFLPYNLPDASMFLGDVGSYLIGGSIAATVIEGSFSRGRLDPRGSVRVLAPMFPYFADTGATIVKRVCRGESITRPHKEHVYQRLAQNAGWSHWAVSSLVAGAAAGCGIAIKSRRGWFWIPPIIGTYFVLPALAQTRR